MSTGPSVGACHPDKRAANVAYFPNALALLAQYSTFLSELCVGFLCRGQNCKPRIYQRFSREATWSLVNATCRFGIKHAFEMPMDAAVSKGGDSGVPFIITDGDGAPAKVIAELATAVETE
eukprot:4628536-Amphidinium_carterae.1